LKDSGSHWLSISDLMAAVVSVVVMLLVVSIMQQAVILMNQRLTQDQSLVVQRQIVTEMFKEMQNYLEQENAETMAKFDYDSYRIVFREGIFEKGSAIVTEDVQEALNKSKPKVLEFLNKLPNGVIYIEGHSDNTPVRQPVINKQIYGAVYDDNYTLSAARAREARNVLLGELPDSLANRIVVAGYGYSKPIDGLNPDNAANRRIEIRFVLEKTDKVNGE
jgi:chemotaxis protein MotB